VTYENVHFCSPCHCVGNCFGVARLPNGNVGIRGEKSGEVTTEVSAEGWRKFHEVAKNGIVLTPGIVYGLEIQTVSIRGEDFTAISGDVTPHVLVMDEYAEWEELLDSIRHDKLDHI